MDVGALEVLNRFAVEVPHASADLFHHILVVEMNDEGIYGYGGQLATLLRARYCDPRIRSVTKTDGLTWKVKEILQRVLTATK